MTIDLGLHTLRSAYAPARSRRAGRRRSAEAHRGGRRRQGLDLARARRASAGAADLDARRGEIDSLPLYGVPFAVKDNIDVAGMTTTAACPGFAYEAADSAEVVRAWSRRARS